MGYSHVFTTNYDTLLERAADKVTNRRYNVVICQEDLVNSNNAPRILKLHGSFPSYRPFIITEEDYRTYPVKFAAMVNTVQQALLVCLLKLQDETVIKQTDSEQEALYKLRCRIISCKIAKELYVRGIKSDIVDGWKRISENKNEFIEIRNVVFDTTGDE